MFLKCFGHSSSSQRQYPTIIEELCHQFSLADLGKSTNNFDQNRVIGRGAFSTVYKGCLQHKDGSDYTVALKRFHEGYSAVFKKEIELLCQLRHPNCVSLIGFCNHEKEKIIVYEYMSNGSLDRHLLRGKLSWKKRVEICIGVACGLHYLHAGAKRSIFHCILRASTILLDEDKEPKLAGFGLSIQGPQFNSKKPKQINADHIMDTLGYMPLEYVMNGSVTDKWDVFSFGLVLLRVVCGMDYFIMAAERKRMEKPVEENIDSNIKGKIAPECWQVFTDIMVRCLEYEPDERPAMGEVEVELEHALSLQEQADITNTDGDYTLLSKTIIPIARGSEMKE
ncbi:Receptor-like protein kinase ANXUR2 [Glycine soja]|uniref:Receptor-like protein kinase ANXUR2 n=1 Tax=Glycine soja TaxID=3848 RepID=A0A0B2RU36_GLYSO|nr:Receptor-like protein kinase ANXUR2 [Glycine soja]